MATADLILVNGRVHTMARAAPPATALVISNGRVVCACNDADAEALASRTTRRVNLAGRVVLPGLVDAHNHLLMTGAVLSAVQLFDCRSIGEITERVAASARTAPAGAWLVGRGWDETLLAERRHPTRHDLDAAAPANPVLLERVWNKLVCNSEALRRAGIDRSTPDPSRHERYAGSFERDADGEPTGLFRDRAKDLIRRVVPPPSPSDQKAAIRTACREYNRLGLTSIAEPGLMPAEIRAFHAAALDGDLTVRSELLLGAWGWGDAADDQRVAERLAAVGVMTGFGDDLVRIGGVKILADGGIGDRTARLGDPYLHEPDNSGTWVVDPDELPRLVRVAHDLGFAIDTHACGDETQAVVAAAYAAAQTAAPNPRLRHRIHHAYLPTAETLRLMASHAIPAVCSNPFLTLLADSFVAALGAERADRVMPLRRYLDAGVPIAGSSDTPVSDHNPWFGIAAACTRRTAHGYDLDPAERLTVHEAIASYTTGGAFAVGRERDVGSLEPGKLADCVILDHDPFALAAADLAGIEPAATLLAGALVAGELER